MDFRAVEPHWPPPPVIKRPPARFLTRSFARAKQRSTQRKANENYIMNNNCFLRLSLLFLVVSLVFLDCSVNFYKERIISNESLQISIESVKSPSLVDLLFLGPWHWKTSKTLEHILCWWKIINRGGVIEWRHGLFSILWATETAWNTKI